jgi:hypothetical protein
MPKQLPSNRVKEITMEKGCTTQEAILAYLDERETEEKRVEDATMKYNIELAKMHKFYNSNKATPVTPSKDEGNKNICLPETKCNLCGMMGNPPWYHQCPGLFNQSHWGTDHPQLVGLAKEIEKMTEEAKPCRPSRVAAPSEVNEKASLVEKLFARKCEAKYRDLVSNSSTMTCGKSLPCPDHPPQPKPRWRPSLGETSYSIDWDGEIVKDGAWEDLEYENARWAFGNCFPSREKAEAAAQAIKELLMKIQGE